MRKVDREARLSFFHPPDLSRPSPSSAAPATKKCTNHKKNGTDSFPAFRFSLPLAAFLLTFKICIHYHGTNSILDCPRIFRAGPAAGMVLLPSDDGSQRRHARHAENRPARAPGRHVLPETTVQGGGHRVPHPVRPVRRHGLRLQPAELVGAGGLPYGRLLLRPFRLPGHEDRHLRLGPHGQRRPRVAQQRPAHRLP